MQVQTREPLRGTPTEKEISVHPDHAENVRHYYAERRTQTFTSFRMIVGITGGLTAVAAVGVLLLLVFPVASQIISHLLLISCSLALSGIGATMIVYPFSTAETISVFGVRRSKQIMRGVGVGCIGAGGVLGLLILWI